MLEKMRVAVLGRSHRHEKMLQDVGKVKVEKELLGLYDHVSFCHPALTGAPLVKTLASHTWEPPF